MTIENFSPKIDKKGLIINPNESVKDQLLNFYPTKDTDYIALQHLTNPEDIKRYFQERVSEIKADDPIQPAERLVLGSLDYISRSGNKDYEKGWELFKKVLAQEIDENIPKPMREEK